MKLEEGEYICSECEGRGSIPSKLRPNILAAMCKKCQGAGKLDWIENIVGKPPVSSAGSSSTSSMSSGTNAMISGMAKENFLSKEDLDFISKQLADSIDNEIIETIQREWKQKDSIMKAAEVFHKIGGPFFDNRIIS